MRSAWPVSWPLATRARVDKQSGWEARGVNDINAHLTNINFFLRDTSPILMGCHLCWALKRPNCVKRGARLGPRANVSRKIHWSELIFQSWINWRQGRRHGASQVALRQWRRQLLRPRSRSLSRRRHSAAAAAVVAGIPDQFPSPRRGSGSPPPRRTCRTSSRPIGQYRRFNFPYPLLHLAVRV